MYSAVLFLVKNIQYTVLLGQIKLEKIIFKYRKWKCASGYRIHINFLANTARSYRSSSNISEFMRKLNLNYSRFVVINESTLCFIQIQMIHHSKRDPCCKLTFSDADITFHPLPTGTLLSPINLIPRESLQRITTREESKYPLKVKLWCIQGYRLVNKLTK